ncbi:MAG: flagellar protein FlaG [Gammaproteobacteria bacterium]|nr:flagellar protein FlaG [Gammaproteobacteria bacterium]
MTSNITAISGTPQTPASTGLQPKVGQVENATQPTRNTSESVTRPDIASTTSESSLAGKITSDLKLQNTKIQPIKAQDAKVQDAKVLANAVNELNQHFKGLLRTSLQFNMDDKSGEMVVKVMDVERNELIRQIPPEEILALAAFFKEKIEKETEQIEQAALMTNKSAPGTSILEGLLLRAKA